MKNYHYQHCKDGEIICSGQLMAKNLHEAKHLALQDSGLNKIDAWLFNIWHDTGYGSIQFRNYGGNNWKARMELNQEYLVVCDDRDVSKWEMLGIEPEPEPTQLALF